MNLNIADHWWCLAVAAFSIGFSKGGFSGVSLVAVYLVAEVLGAKEAAGWPLPLMILADIMVYPDFRKQGSWGQVWPLLWPSVLGLGVGMIGLKYLEASKLRHGIGWVILIMAVLQFLKILFSAAYLKIAQQPVLGVIAAGIGGIASMIANAAGPVMQLYLKSRGVAKLELLGISARFFLLINLIKLPLSGGLGLITWESLKWNLWLSPLLLFGVYAGQALVKKIPERAFGLMVVVFAIVAGLRLQF